MPATALTPVNLGGSAGRVVAGTGNAEVAADTGNGNSFPNQNGKALLLVRNSGATPRTVTITTPNTEDGNAVADPVVNIAASVSTIIGPLRADVYGTTVTVTGSHAELMFTAINQAG